jgi:hypothetical protein
MKRRERWALNLSSLAVALTGFAYFWMKDLLGTDDPFAVVNHPWQGAMLHLHVLAAPVFVLVFGYVFNSHVMKKLRATRIPNRKSGLAALAMFAVMLASGYLLQTASDETWLRGLVVTHVASGVAFSLVYAAHLVVSVRLARRQPEVAREVA